MAVAVDTTKNKDRQADSVGPSQQVRKPAAVDRPAVPEAKTKVSALMKREGIAHIVRAGKRFTERLGTQFAAAITYFSFLAIVPIMMLGFSVAGFVLSSRPELLLSLRNSIAKQIPGDLSKSISTVLDTAVNARLSVGIIGLVLALYSGISWMGNVRNAIQAQWRPDFDDDQETANETLIKNLSRNLLSLAGLGLAMVISIALTAGGSSATNLILRLLGLDGISWLKPVFTVVPILLAMAADVLIFMWVYTILPPRNMKAPRKALIRGSIIAAVAFEILKLALTLFPGLLNSATAKLFGPIIGLLFFFNITATMVLFVAAWIATSPGGPAKEQTDSAEDEAPRAIVVTRDVVAAPKVAGWLGLGALLGWGWGRRQR